MMKKAQKWFALSMAVVLILFSFSACSSSYKSPEITGDYSSITNETADIAYDKEFSETLATTGKAPDIRANRKIIENIALSVQTKTFDALLESITQQIELLGGYVESSNISGREIDSYRNRSADMKIRIPVEQSETFSNYISENSVVVNRSVTTEDITLTYVDVESRISALEKEKASLERLLERAETVDEIISVQSKLTEVIYTLESYQSQLRTYDNLIDYCTIDLYIYEVERTVVVEEQTVWQEIGTNLETNFSAMWNGIVDIFVFAVSSLPFLLPFVVIAVIVIVIVVVQRRSAKKKALKLQQPAEKK